MNYIGSIFSPNFFSDDVLERQGEITVKISKTSLDELYEIVEKGEYINAVKQAPILEFLKEELDLPHRVYDGFVSLIPGDTFYIVTIPKNRKESGYRIYKLHIINK